MEAMTTYSNASYQHGQYNVPKIEACGNMGVGQPGNHELPLKEFSDTLKDIASATNPALLQYGDIPGYVDMRQSLATYLRSLSDTKITKDNIFVTNGVTGALSLLMSVLGKTGLTVFAEDPTYFIALNIFKDFKMVTKPVPIEGDGLDVDNLEKQLKTLPKTERCFLYTIPIHNNPTGYSMSEKKRTQLMSLLDKYPNLVVIADEVYQHLSFDESNRYLPFADSHQNCISIGSFSKTFAPALRIGWIHADNKWLTPLKNSGQMDSGGSVNPIGTAIVHRLIESGRQEVVRKRWVNYLSTNCTKLYNEVVKQLSEYVEVEKPTGGYFLWLKLKKQKSGSEFMAKELATIAPDFKVKFHSGEKFSAVQASKDRIRLSFSWYVGDELTEAVSRMKTLFDVYYNVQQCVNPDLVYVLGATGRLGSLVVNQMKKSDRYNLKDTLKRDFDLKGSLYGTILDVSLPEGTDRLFTQLLEYDHSVPVVVGTTGLSKDTITKMKIYSKKAPVALVSNFSLGIPQFYQLMDAINKDQWNAKLEEWHHVHKKDAPSGTAKSLKNAYDSELPITSYREGEIVGDHMLTLDSKYESITIKHHAKDRNLFASGALRWVSWLALQAPGFYTKMSSKVTVEKWSGAGNTFVVIDDENELYDEKTRVELTKKYCSSTEGVGADGAIFVGPWKKFNKNEVEVLARVWRYFNKDGSHVSMCGNGARVTAGWIYQREGNPKFLIANVSDKTVVTAVRYINKNRFEINMEVNEECELAKSYKSFRDNVYDVSVPHYVEVYKTRDEMYKSLRKLAYKSDLKRDGMHLCEQMNVTGYKINKVVNANDYYIDVATFERGVEEITPACGTGCCAVAMDIMKKKKLRFVMLFCTVPSGNVLKVILDHNDDQLRCSLSGPSKMLFKTDL